MHPDGFAWSARKQIAKPLYAGVGIRRGLTVLQTARLVHELVDAEPEAYGAVLARWSVGVGEAAATRLGVRAACGVADTISLDVARLRKSGGRLESCLVATPAALSPGAADLIRHHLGEPGGVLVALSRAIAAALTLSAGSGAA